MIKIKDKIFFIFFTFKIKSIQPLDHDVIHELIKLVSYPNRHVLLEDWKLPATLVVPAKFEACAWTGTSWRSEVWKVISTCTNLLIPTFFFFNADITQRVCRFFKYMPNCATILVYQRTIAGRPRRAMMINKFNLPKKEVISSMKWLAYLSHENYLPPLRHQPVNSLYYTTLQILAGWTNTDVYIFGAVRTN